MDFELLMKKKKEMALKNKVKKLYSDDDYDFSDGYKEMAHDIADEIEKVVISSKERIVTTTLEFVREVCENNNRLDIWDQVENDRIDNFFYFDVFNFLQEKSRDKNTSFSMRKVPLPKDMNWGTPYDFEYIFKNSSVK